jgi:hypothetical protein
MSDFSFEPYQAVYDAFNRDIRQLDEIDQRLLASAHGVRGECGTKISMLGKLKTIETQLDKLPESYEAARAKFDTAIDAADQAYVQKVQGLCSLAVATGRADAGVSYRFSGN